MSDKLNSIVDNFNKEVDNFNKEGDIPKKGSWFVYNEGNYEYDGPYKTKADAIEAARESFSESSSCNTDEEETVWLCQAVQKVIFTRKVHVVESDE